MRKTVNRRKSAILALFATLIILSVLTGCLTGCSSGTTYSYYIREEAEITKTDYTGYNVLPKPEGKTQTTIQYINLDGESWATLMLMETLQGNVNRGNPSMYIVHNYLVEGNPSLNATQYWLDKLDETYVDEDGNPVFEKVEYTDYYKMLLDNLDKVSGVILYDSRLTDSCMGGKGAYADIYSDVALLNLTLMMCGQENSIAVNETQYNYLKSYFNGKGENIDDYLPIKGDTTKFMKRDFDGSIDYSPASKKDADVYMRCYEYALTKYAGEFCDKVISHNPGFQAGQFDFLVQNKVFIYNRSLSTGIPGKASERENQLELDILAVTPYNTPVIGVWYLHLDEANYINFLTANGKFFMVSYESFNWSWSTGLDYETIETEEDMEIEYDDSKIYLAFSFTEGDNNSYLQFKMPELYDSEYKGEYPFSWTIAPTLWDSNPNIIKYYAMNYSAGDGLCIPEAGVDYVDPAPPANTAADFYALTDEYIGRVGNGCIRTLQHNLIDALSYAENLKNIESLLCGYGIGISNNYNHNTGASDFLFRDIPYFNQYDGRDVYDTFKYIEETGNNFYSISYSGWEHSLEDLMDLMSTLDDRFVVVTQRQLAKLYKERYLAEYTDVTKVNFSPDMSRDEMAYLYKASVYSDFDGNEKIRYASGDNYFIYRIRPDSAVTEAKLNLSIQGDYSVEVSTDYRKWYVLETGKSSDIANISVNIPSFLIGKQIFVRFGDGTPENGGGVQLHNFNFSTNLSEIDSVEINTLRDAAYNTSDGGEPTADGRSGKFVYALNLKSSVNRADLAVGMMSPEQNLTVRISRDNKNFEKVNTVVYGSTAYAQLGGLNDVVYIEFSSDEAIRSVKFASDAEAVGSVNFRPLGNGIDKTYGLSQDQTEISVGSDVAGQYRGIGIEQALVYAFNLKDVETATLTLNILGQYNVAAGTDLANLTTLENVELGDLPDAVRTFDISSLVVSGKKLYLKIEKSMANLSKVSLKLIRITTDKNEEYLNGKIALENAKTALLTPTSGEETAVIDAAHSHDYGVYVDQSGPTRVINSAANGVLVYKFCFTEANSAYWAAMGLDLSEGELTDVSVVALVANSYKLEISGDGVNYDVISDVSDLVVNGTNKGKIRFSAAEYLGENKTFYFRFSRGSSWNGSHEAILYNLRFSFEQAVG